MPGLEAAVSLGVTVAVVLPHLLAMHRVTPAVAAAVWICALALRALVAIGGALFVMVYLPQTGVYDALAHWCWHEALPVVATHLGLSGHPLVHAAVVLPGLALALSVLWLLFGLMRGWLLLRVKLRSALGEGPLGSTIIEDDGILIGVTGLGRSRIVVSDGALGEMDPAELEASLSHELGHIRRRHQPLLLLSAAFAALGRMLPGTRAAERELRFSLERDADEYAVARTTDPLALASAICKVATALPVKGATGLGGNGRIALRLDYLEGHRPRAGRSLERTARGLAVVLVVITATLLATLPSWALAAPKSQHTLSIVGSHCPSN